MTTGTAERPRVGDLLRALRTGAGLGGTQAAAAAGMSQSKVSKIETGRLRPSDGDIRVLCRVYGASDRQRDELVELAAGLREASRRSRVVMSRGAAGYQARLGRLEASAQQLRSFQPAMVIGLVQTPDYARVVLAEALSGDDLDAAVDARRHRATALDDPAKHIVLIMSEGALRWQVGGPDVMAGQIDHLADVSRRPNVRLGIIPWTTPMRVTCTHGFHLYDQAAVVFGTEVSSGVLDEPDDIAAYEQLFGQIEQAAAFGDDARRELARIGGEYRLLLG